MGFFLIGKMLFVGFWYINEELQFLKFYQNVFYLKNIEFEFV